MFSSPQGTVRRADLICYLVQLFPGRPHVPVRYQFEGVAFVPGEHVHVEMEYLLKRRCSVRQKEVDTFAPDT